MIPQEKIDQLAEAALRAQASESSPASPESAGPPAGGLDSNFHIELEARERRLKKKRALQSRSVTWALFAVVAGGAASYHFSPSFKARVDGLMQNVRQSGKDVKTIGTITGSYDKQLEKVAAHGDQLDQATRSLGGDPAQTVAGDPNFDKQVMELTGENPSSTDRAGQLKEKFGGVQKLAGQKEDASSVP